MRNGKVSNLERMGAIVRRPHAVHGRIQHLDLSESGRALLVKCRSRAHAVERDLAADLPSAEDQTIRRWLVRIATAEPPSAKVDLRRKSLPQ